jgi:beta-phosphoglucomutase-like phosphatase (HAD superfamily)
MSAQIGGVVGTSIDESACTPFDVKQGKPDTGLSIAAADKFGVHIDEYLAIGDAIWDMLAARREGHRRRSVIRWVRRQ